MSKYVIITPAKNEDRYIERTIQSVISQTLMPSRWIIVDDGSTDHTAEIVSKYLVSYDFIRLVRLATGARDFASKVRAFNAGRELLIGTEYSWIGNLDADVSFGPELYGNLISEFMKDPRLGIAGGQVYCKVGRRFVTYDTTLDSVGGQAQLFRRDCFDEVGGYLPLELGGEDAGAEIIARMKGWRVRKFPANKVYEHRRAGFAHDKALVAMYKLGARFHSLGYGTVFYIGRVIHRLGNNPPVIGSACALLGFLYARLTGCPVGLPPDAVSYLRSEQMGKLRGIIRRKVGLGPEDMAVG